MRLCPVVAAGLVAAVAGVAAWSADANTHMAAQFSAFAGYCLSRLRHCMSLCCCQVSDGQKTRQEDASDCRQAW